MDNLIWKPLSPPEFHTAKEQFIWYLKRFCHYCIYCGRRSGISTLPGDDSINVIMSTLGDDFIIGKILDIRTKYGESLTKESLTSVSKVVAELSNGINVSTITDEMKAFTDFLQRDDVERRRFFSYWRQLSSIIGD